MSQTKPVFSSRPARCRDSILHPGGRLWTDWQNSGPSFLGATVTAVIRWWWGGSTDFILPLSLGSNSKVKPPRNVSSSAAIPSFAALNWIPWNYLVGIITIIRIHTIWYLHIYVWLRVLATPTMGLLANFCWVLVLRTGVRTCWRWERQGAPLCRCLHGRIMILPYRPWFFVYPLVN